MTVAIIGRPNVGKSALFNCLAGRRVSIVHDEPGVTRDRIVALCKRGNVSFEIVDTGGIGANPDPDFAVATRDAADMAIAGANVLLLVVDAKDGITPLDSELARQLRSTGLPLLLVINKVDHEGMEVAALADFSRLGIPEVLTVSAAHGLGISTLIESIEKKLPTGKGSTDAGENDDTLPTVRLPHLAIVGKPNVGKSSLTNALLGNERTIVSDIPGTTRDAIDIAFEHEGTRYILCDTAGIRHRSRHNTSVEVFSVMRSEQSLRRADLCVLVIDATQGVTNQDQKIANLIQRAGTACVIALNKWDLIAGDSHSDRELLAKHIEKTRSELFFLPHAPIVILSAKEKTNVRRLMTTIEKIRQHASRRMGTGELNRLLRDAFERQPPPMRSNRRFKLLYATQISEADIPRPFAPPVVLLFVNAPELMPDAYRNYLAARIRDKWEYLGLPLIVRLRGREENAKENVETEKRKKSSK